MTRRSLLQLPAALAVAPVVAALPVVAEATSESPRPSPRYIMRTLLISSDLDAPCALRVWDSAARLAHSRLLEPLSTYHIQAPFPVKGTFELHRIEGSGELPLGRVHLRLDDTLYFYSDNLTRARIAPEYRAIAVFQPFS